MAKKKAKAAPKPKAEPAPKAEAAPAAAGENLEDELDALLNDEE